MSGETKWSDEAWKAIEHVFAKILDQDFVRGLGDGTLDQSKFLYYMRQDKLYLDDYSRALALIGIRAPDIKDTVLYTQFSQNAALAEQSLHEFYLNHVGAENTELHGLWNESQKNITCELYTSFLLRHAALSPVEVAAAATLPCFWIYDAVGVHHTGMLKDAKAQGKPHPFAKWIETYSSPEFTADTVKARAFCDKLAASVSAERRQEMTEAFVKASIMEYMFWKAAWEDEKWSI